MNNQERYLLSLIARAKNEEMEDFSDKEIKRVFKNTSYETKNVDRFKELSKHISIFDVYIFNEPALLDIIRR